MNLNANDSTPLYKQVKENIVEQIHSGVLKPGEQLKSEPDLAIEYKVSRTTIRSAINKLAEQNMLVKAQGKGTFVSSRKIERDIVKVMSHTEICAISGMIPGSRTVSKGVSFATQEDANLLNVQPGDKLINILRLRFADGVPVILEDLAFRWAHHYLLNEDIERGSLYELLRTKYNINPIRSQKQIEPTFANEKQAQLLCVPDKYPLILITGFAATSDGERIHRTYQHVLGDRFKFIV